MNNWRAGALGFVLGLMAASASSDADAEQSNVPTQMQCAPSIEIAASALERGYGETPQVGGITNTAGLLMFANTETGTWTLIIVFPDGSACSPASGTNFAIIPQGEVM